LTNAPDRFNKIREKLLYWKPDFLRLLIMRWILYTGLMMLPQLGFTQEAGGDAPLFRQINEGKEAISVPELKKPARERIEFGLEAGASFTSFGRQGSLFGTYLAPEIRYRATPRFHFSAGVIISSGFMPQSGFMDPGRQVEKGGSGGKHFSRFLVFAEGTYRVNQRLTLGGMVVKELDHDIYRQMNAFQKNTGFQSVGMSLNYKITDNIHVGARFNVTEGRPYYFSDPTMPYMRPAPWGPGW
jgi:hypothetical protein